jgi:subtilisin family serine protease
MRSRLVSLALGLLLAAPMWGAPISASAAPQAPADRLVVLARGDADYDRLRDTVRRAGGTIVRDVRAAGMLVVRGNAGLRAQVEASGLTRGIARDHVEKLFPTEAARQDRTFNTGLRVKTALGEAASAAAAASLGKRVNADPAFDLPGLMWSIDRIEAPDAWRTTTGDPRVTVAVADTGIDSTHSDLANRVALVQDFTRDEDPPLCSTFLPNPLTGADPGIGDQDLSALLGGPADGDWNGHGTWIAGNIAAALDHRGVNGIAPNVTLVSLKVSQWCGLTYDSTIIEAFQYAGDHHLDVVNISIGSYLDLSDPDEQVIWDEFNRAVQRARNQGTLIVAAAGNESARIGDSGRVLSHGTLTNPGNPLDDEFGNFSVPGGLPGVIDVAATVNVVGPSSGVCQPNTFETDLAVCKPKSDAHQPTGQGKEDQLAYFSNYGPRIDLAAPGGARKFNIPGADRGGTPGYPYTTNDGTTAFAAFSTTSNWGLEVPCFTLLPRQGFRADQCYTVLQGTSMAAPHVAAVAGLIASTDRDARGRPDRLERLLKSSARDVSGNETRALDPNDQSPGDRTGIACATGYCHLGGPRIPDSEVYGAGVVDARRAVDR